MKFRSLAKKRLCEARFRVFMRDYVKDRMALVVRHPSLTTQHQIHVESEVEKVSLEQDFPS
jgi:hypothetical protein